MGNTAGVHGTSTVLKAIFIVGGRNLSDALGGRSDSTRPTRTSSWPRSFWAMLALSKRRVGRRGRSKGSGPPYRLLSDQMLSVNNSTSGAKAHLPFDGNGASGNSSRLSGIWALDQFTRWQSMNWDYAGKLQKAQMHVLDLPDNPDLRLP